MSGSLDVCLRLSPNSCLPWSASFVSLHFSPSCWWCLPFRMPIFTCPSCVSLSAWWCLALWMSVFTVPNNPPVSQSSARDVFTRLKFIRLTVWPGGAWLSGCLSSLVCQFICFPVWLVVTGCPDVCLHLSPNSCVCQSRWSRLTHQPGSQRMQSSLLEPAGHLSAGLGHQSCHRQSLVCPKSRLTHLPGLQQMPHL